MRPSASSDRRSKRTILGSLPWTSAGELADGVLTLVGLSVAARVVAPDQFGLIGFSMVALGVIEALTQPGFSQALIQRRSGLSVSTLDAFFTLQLARSIFVFGLVLVLAPTISDLFKQPAASPILRALGAIIVLRGALSPEVILWHRSLRFKRVFLVSITQGVMRVTLMVSLALVWRNAWALVAAALGAAFAQALASHTLSERRPRFVWRRDEAKRLIAFGKWITGMSILSLIMNEGDDLFVTHQLGIEATAFYQFAFHLANLPTTYVGRIISRVTFPTYAALRQRTEQLRETFVAVFSTTLLIAGALTITLWLSTPWIVAGILGPRWAPIIPITRLLLVAGLLRALVGVAGSLFVGVGRPELDLWMNAPRALVLMLLIYPLGRIWGLQGIASAVIVGMVATIPIWISGVRRHTGAQLGDIARALIVPVACLATLIGAHIVPLRFRPYSSLWIEAMMIVLTTALWIALIVYADRKKYVALLEPLSVLRRPIDDGR